MWQEICSTTVRQYLQECQDRVSGLINLIDPQSEKHLINMLMDAVAEEKLTVSQAGTVYADHTVLYEMVQFVVYDRQARIAADEVAESLTRALCRFAVSIRGIYADMGTNEMYLRILVVNREQRQVLEVYSLGRQAKFINSFSPVNFPKVDRDVVQGPHFPVDNNLEWSHAEPVC